MNVGGIDARRCQNGVAQQPGLWINRERDELLRRAYGSVKVFVVCADGLAPRRARKRSFANATQLTAAGVHVVDGDALLTAFGDVKGQGGCRGLKGRTEEEEDEEKMWPAHRSIT